jgi:hypothetical protein
MRCSVVALEVEGGGLGGGGGEVEVGMALVCRLQASPQMGRSVLKHQRR